MLEILNELDRIVFLLINVFSANPVTDAIMPVITSDTVLKVVFGFLMIMILWRGDRRSRWLILFAAFTLLVTDQTSSNFLKHAIERPRPCHVFTDIHLLVPCGGGFSMPSSHAANVFGQAVVISSIFRWTKWPLMIFAVSVALSRVFVGVHYPGDILVGSTLGIVAGYIISKLYKAFVNKVFPVGAVTDETTEEQTDTDEPDTEETADDEATAAVEETGPGDGDDKKQLPEE